MARYPCPLVVALAVCLPALSCRDSVTASEVASKAGAAASSAAAAEAAAPVECRSLLGLELRRIAPTGERLEHYEAELAAARARWESGGAESDAIWVGRHLGYLGRYGEAVDWYSRRIEDFPISARLLRHRGHRYLSLRRLGLATDDLEHAWDLARLEPDAIEPDGAPNAAGIPRSTTQTNVLYHLALAYYLQGDFELAAAYFKECADRSPNDDMLVAALNWQVHALRREGREDQVRLALQRVAPEMDVIENHAYQRILLLQKGELTEEQVLDVAGDGVQNATAAYGVACWAFCNGEQERARELWRRIVDETPWNAFGHLCAEAELAR